MRSGFALMVVLILLGLLAILALVKAAPGAGDTTTTTGDPVTVTTTDPKLERELRAEHRRLLQARRRLRHRWRPTVHYAIRLAASMTGVSAGEMYRVAWCESRFDPYAQNGRYKGVFQLGWRPFGMSPYDPVANALSAAATVRRDGGWRQWECKP